MRRAISLIAGMAIGTMVPLLAQKAAAQDAVAQFYAGKQIELVVGTTPGGGYDLYARLLARHMPDYIPGRPTMVPKNMPGAGGNTAAAYSYDRAARDGTSMQAALTSMIVSPIFGGSGIHHDSTKFLYVGSANSEVSVCFARADAPVKSFAEVFDKELILGAATSSGSVNEITAMLNNVLGTRLRLVRGYPGSTEMLLAVTEGEVQGLCGLTYSTLSSQQPALLTNGTVNILSQGALVGNKKLSALGVPLTTSFAKNDEDRQVMEFVYSQGEFGRPFLLPPGVPQDRVAALRKAFMQTMRDPAFLADAEKVRLDVDPISGEELQLLVNKIYATPKRIIDRAKDALVYREPA